MRFEHEHNRDDNGNGVLDHIEDPSNSCTASKNGGDGDATYGPWDSQSILNYCNSPRWLSAYDRAGTDRVYGQTNIDIPYIMNLDGKNGADLLCHNVESGTISIDYSDGNGRFGSIDWTNSTSWCNHGSGRLYKGDFNGDGRGDILCHDLVSGYKWIDFANTSGRFGGTDFYRSRGWCNHDNGQLFIGDFNGDSRDDLLCSDVADGRKWIDYADANGEFYGTNWSTSGNWCVGTNYRIFVTDFNGDNRDDLLCHNVSNGYKYIDYADSNGQFNGTDWSRNSGWCTHVNGEFFTGYFNNDARADFLCHDILDGRLWIDYADTSGRFSGTDWTIDSECGTESVAPTARLFVGNFDNMLGDDLLCHDVALGGQWISYADINGHFNTIDAGGITGFCDGAGQTLH